jgi:hypothetical protein
MERKFHEYLAEYSKGDTGIEIHPQGRRQDRKKLRVNWEKR